MMSQNKNKSFKSLYQIIFLNMSQQKNFKLFLDSSDLIACTVNLKDK